MPSPAARCFLTALRLPSGESALAYCPGYKIDGIANEIAANRIMYDVWQGFRKCDKELADATLQPCFDFMNSQTDPRRLTKMNLEQYLDYRLDDVGKE